jgi:hypothetical protein
VEEMIENATATGTRIFIAIAIFAPHVPLKTVLATGAGNIELADSWEGYSMLIGI